MNYDNGWPTAAYPMNPIASQKITLGDAGELGNDGLRYKAIPGGQTLDVTPNASGVDFYWFGVGYSKYTPHITANRVVLDRKDIVDGAAFSVGQKVVLAVELGGDLPAVKQVDSTTWNLPSDYRNAKKFPNASGTDYYISTCYPHYEWVSESVPMGRTGRLCTQYLTFDHLLLEESTGAWWISEGVKGVGCSKTFTFNNGQQLSIEVLGRFYINKPFIYISDIFPRDFSGGYFSGVSLGVYANGEGSGGMTYNINFLTEFPGQAAITQLILADYSFPGPAFSDFRLDGPELYSTAPIATEFDPSTFKFISFDDFPGNPGGHRLKASFKDYIRFMPEGDDNIYATVGLVTWHINGDISVSGQWLSKETPDPSGPSDSSEFPSWTASYR